MIDTGFFLCYYANRRKKLNIFTHFKEPYGLLFLELNSPPYGFFVVNFSIREVILC